MNLRILLCGTLALSIAVLSLRAADESDEGHPPSFWMQKKLEYSEKVLEGLAKADYEEIATNAKLLNMLNQIEDFVRGRDEEYRRQLDTFDHVTRQLAHQANEENIDGAAIAYMQLTMNCVSCHKHLRDHEDF